MTSIIIPRNVFNQPQGRVQVRTDYSVRIPEVFVGGSTVNGSSLIRLGTNFIQPNPDGVVGKTNSASGLIALQFYNPTLNASVNESGVGLFGLFRAPTQSSNAVVLGFGSDSGSSGNTLTLVGLDGANVTTLFGSSNSSGSWINTGQTYGMDKLVAIYITVYTSPTGYTLNADTYINGRKLTQFAQGGIGGSLPYNYVVLGGNKRVNWSYGAACEVPLMFPTIGRLSDSEAIALTANPWQLFKADPVRIYSFATPPSLPSLNLLTTDNITPTGARHNLTLSF